MQVDGFITALARDFYARKLQFAPNAAPPAPAEIVSHVFATSPSHGVAVITPEFLPALP